MAFIEWQEDFAIGIPSADYEHRKLIEMINSLYDGLSPDARPADTSRFLGELEARIAAHFALEEKTMRDIAYHAYAAHKEDHEILLDRIRDIADAFDNGAYGGCGARLAADLTTWFAVHFRTKDAALHGAVRAEDA